MALEFALRPRFNLERPEPKRGRLSLRLPRVALPIVAYWLAMAGGTYILLGVLGEESTAVAARPAARPRPLVTTPEPPAASALAEGFTSGSSPKEPPPTTAQQVDAEASTSPPSDTPASDTPASDTPASDAPAAALPWPAPSSPAPVAERPPHPVDTARPAPRLRPAAPPPPAPASDHPTPTPPPAIGTPAVSEPPRDQAPLNASLPSCESAAASANQRIDVGAGRGAPDLTRDLFARVLENGSYLSQCSLPARTALEICAAVQDGKVVGLSVSTEPRNPAIAACVRRAVSALRFPRNPSLDVTRTRFEAQR